MTAKAGKGLSAKCAEKERWYFYALAWRANDCTQKYLPSRVSAWMLTVSPAKMFFCQVKCFLRLVTRSTL